MTELVNIVIPAYNSFPFLKDCLEAIPKACQDSDFFITIVDNGSDKEKADTFYGYLEEHKDHIHVERLRENMGFPIACNIGAKRKASPLIFFLNADVTLREGAIDELVRTMDDPEVGIVGMKLLFPEDSPHGSAGRIQHAGLAMSINARPYHLFLGWEADHPKVEAMDDAWAVTGAALMTRRSIWNKVGGFNEEYGMGCLVGDTLVPTNIGIKELDSLDMFGTDYKTTYSVASNKETKRASIFHVNGEHETIKITTEKRFTLEGTPDHKVISMSEDGEIVWKSLEDLNINDYVALRRGSEVFGFLDIEDDLAYLAGLYISEGSYESESGSGRITITNQDKEVCEFLEDKGFSLQGDGIHWRSLVRHSDLVENLRREVGIDFSQKSLQKEIPDGILSSQKHSQISFLRGLFDGDGSGMKSGEVTYASSSKRLIEQLQVMLLNLGIVSAIYSKDERLSDNTAYILDLLGDSKKFYKEIGFSVSRKQENKKYVPDRRSDTIPYQRKYLKDLYKKAQEDVGGYWKSYNALSQSKSHSVTRRILERVLVDFLRYKGLERAYDRIEENLDNDYVWVKINKKECGSIKPTYDLHVPDTNAYVANGFVVHNTFEDLDLSLTVAEKGYKIKLNTDAVGEHYVGHTNQQFPLSRNHQIFMNKWGRRISWNEWKYL